MALENESGPIREKTGGNKDVKSFQEKHPENIRVSINGVQEIEMKPGEIAYGSQDVFTTPGKSI